LGQHRWDQFVVRVVGPAQGDGAEPGHRFLHGRVARLHVVTGIEIAEPRMALYVGASL
jgi:hypothetical protein